MMSAIFQGSDGDAAVALAMKHPEKYVMKPQSEGGGKHCLSLCQLPEQAGLTMHAAIVCNLLVMVGFTGQPMFTFTIISPDMTLEGV